MSKKGPKPSKVASEEEADVSEEEVGSEGELSVETKVDKENEELNLTPWELEFITQFVAGYCPYYALRRFCRRFQSDPLSGEHENKLRLAFNNESKFKSFRQKAKPIISEVASRLKHSGLHKKTLRYVSFGIGAAGHDITKTYLKCSEEIKLFRLYAQKHNFYLGSTVEEGTVPCFVSVKERIKYACVCAWECKASLVLYYTGHGFGETGNWSFYDGEMSFATLQAVINEAKADFGIEDVPDGAKTFVICDSCCSGHWCKFSDPDIKVVAACSPEEVTYGDFARVFFKAKLRFTDSEIRHFKVVKLQNEIQKHVGGAIDHSLKKDLCERLQDLETDKRNGVIDDVMKSEPCCTGKKLGEFSSLSRKDVVHRLWFKSKHIKSKHIKPNEEEEELIPELAYLTI